MKAIERDNGGFQLTGIHSMPPGAGHRFVVVGAELEVEVWPGHGFVISSLRHRETSTDLLWRTTPEKACGDLALGSDGGIASFGKVFMGGWFPMFPGAGLPGRINGELMPLHGVACRLSWRVEMSTPEMVICQLDHDGWRMSRTLKVSDEWFELTMDVQNTGSSPRSFVCGEHPCLSRSAFAGGRVDLRPRGELTVPTPQEDPLNARFKPDAAGEWPNLATSDHDSLDASRIPFAPDGRHDHLCVSHGGSVSVHAPQLGGSLEMRPQDGSLPHLLLWQCYEPVGSDFSSVDALGLELMSYRGRSMESATKTGSIMRLEPGASYRYAVAFGWSSQAHPSNTTGISNREGGP